MEKTEVVTDTVKTETVETEKVETPKAEKTFTRDEFNSALAGEKKKLETSLRASIMEEIKKDADVKRSEADKLAKMNDDEKKEYALNQERIAKEQAQNELNAYKLKETAIDIASEKGMDLTLVSILDYTNETAESVKDKMSKMDDVFKKAVESAVNQKLKETSPKNVVGGQNSAQSYLDKKYANNPFYKK